ncbi:class I adenylate-forming enzyme family protein [Sinomonas notoginsengisoli]|uniref:class I adenylate-forming enzyme family protein n=1 Tax=Sinomonas notoginsengisoli TaxID=1457311 RepID=UPI001F1D5589|nr:AMP-binding protein [Sinomonas notoginsengisoli]
MDIATTLRWAAERYPRRCAVGGARPLTYSEWDVRTDGLASSLIALGCVPGDRVVLMLSGGEPLASLHLAAQKAGLTSVPLSTRFSAVEMAYCVADCSPALIIADDATSELVEQACASLPGPPPVIGIDELRHADPKRLPDAPAGSDYSLMLYTSGTTGKPKGVPRTHRAEHSAAVAHLLQTGQPPGAVSLGVMPLFHTMGMRSLLASIVCGGTWVPQAKFDAEESIGLIIDHGVDSLYLVPTIYWSLLQTGRLDQARSVRRLAYAGAPMSPTLAGQLVESVRPERFINHFGSTEIYTFTIGPDGARKPGCAGRAGIFSRVRLVDPTPGADPDALVVPGEQGQIAVSMASPEAFAGYWNRPDADAKSIRDGWYFPGDLAVEDDDGDLWVSGRVDDMINSGGENLFPEDIESALAGCPYLDQVIVAGTPHEKWGSAVTAFFVPADRNAPREALALVQSWVRQESGLAPLKRPKRYVAVDAIPTSAVGKILRRRLVGGDYQMLADSDEENTTSRRSTR